MAAPPSQKYRTIGFRLEGGLDAPETFTFQIRPEELNVSEPSLLTAQRTLGGAWADSWDRDIATINLSGHNGWRGGFLQSGEDAFLALREICFAGWHKARADVIAAGGDPDDVKLYFTDNLDSIAVVVAPKMFSLRRSKTSPLLMRYQIQLLVLGDASDSLGLVDSIINALSNPLRWIAGQLGLTNVISTISSYVTQGQALFGAITGAVTGFVNVGLGLISSVASIAQTAQGQFDGAAAALLTVGQTFSTAGSNAFRALASDPTLPASQRLPLMALASNLNDAACTMSNSFNPGRYFTSFDDLLGASGCSSTGGGREWSTYTAEGLNPFVALSPSEQPLVSVSLAAAAALTTLKGDPLALVGQQATVVSLMNAAAAGVVMS